MTVIRNFNNLVVKVLLVLFIGVGMSMTFVEMTGHDLIEFCESSESQTESESNNGNELNLEDEVDAHLTKNMFAHDIKVGLMSNFTNILSDVYLNIVSPPPELV